MRVLPITIFQEESEGDDYEGEGSEEDDEDGEGIDDEDQGDEEPGVEELGEEGEIRCYILLLHYPTSIDILIKTICFRTIVKLKLTFFY